MLTLFHVSDLHFGYEDREALDWFVAEVARARPAAVLCTGDLTMRGTAREFAAASEWLAALPVPVALVPGNHDVPYYNHMLRRLARPYARYHELAARIDCGLDLPQLAVVPLKTIARAQFRLNWSKGRVSNPDLDAALAGLERQRDKPLRLVIGHHPLVDADTESSGSTRGGKRALAALARAGADVVLSGHVHDAFDMTLDAEGLPIRLIGAGTLSKRLRSTPPGYNRLEWSETVGLTCTLVSR
ncbi:metallophosphoesterase [Novosphingobium sp.]|uniref:metallophosphoesterase family protein n=1 Tax=Novosphingobium sp. TaxID=1874826 RepID=UPI0025FB31F2|nr:metallophosphoesterase [Novosphingobium sp.]MCC6927188.1 metallophosphoesterase [Novosphingobium sp.]